MTSRVDLPETVLERAEPQHIAVAKPRGLDDALPVEVGAIAAAEIHQPILLLALSLDDGMPAGNQLVQQDNLVRRCPAQ